MYLLAETFHKKANVILGPIIFVGAKLRSFLALLLKFNPKIGRTCTLTILSASAPNLNLHSNSSNSRNLHSALLVDFEYFLSDFPYLVIIASSSPKFFHQQAKVAASVNVRNSIQNSG
ncbi:12587_t:CDS:2 [Ambispora gerdemannii]|uniref:12587_t:CDS:1 n=1 Tax=Ambispora gerdemannii TaxID=144530 RepID=A0A9N8ZLN2_9GLOM|nr:12587_t:CDS:2 [Ambispora gerdemannii]